MHKYIAVFIIALLITGCFSKQKYKNINSQKAVKMINSSTNLVILDVRTFEEYSAGNVPNSVNIDIMATDFRTKINNLDKTKEYLIYCRSGNRSTQASMIMATNGFLKIYNLEGAGYESLINALLTNTN